MCRRIFIVIFVCLCFTNFVKGQIPLPEQTGQITGYVYDSETLESLEAASVMLLETMEVVYTTADGAFLFEKVEPGEYTVMAEAENYREEEQIANVTAGQTVELEFYLQLQLNFFQKILRILKSPPMLEFYL